VRLVLEFHEGCQPAVGDLSDEKPLVGDDQLALRIDDGERAAEERQVVFGFRHARKVQLVQLLAADVEPEGLAGRRIIGRTLAELAGDVAQDAAGEGMRVGHRLTP